jgi:hypothetical protein
MSRALHSRGAKEGTVSQALHDEPHRLGREAVAETRHTVLVAVVAILSLVVGAAVQIVFPPAPRTLIVLGDGSGTSAETFGDSALVVDYEYIPGSGLSDATGLGAVYQLQLLGDPLDLLTELGSVYGVEGQARPSQFFDEMWPGYALGPEDWSGPTLNLTWSDTGPWYYSNPAAYQEPTCREVPPEEGSEGLGGFECENPEPSGPLPSLDEATRMAVDLLQKSGLDVTESDLTVLANDDWGVGLSAIQQLDGFDTALEWSVFFGPGPTLASVSGHAATPVFRGEFSTVSPLAAVERLASGQWWGSPAPLYHSGFDSIFIDGFVMEEPYYPEPGGVISLTVESSEVAPLLILDASGTAWLVPGYIMRHGSEPWNASAVISLEEGVIQLPKPMMVGIMPLPEGEQS